MKQWCSLLRFNFVHSVQIGFYSTAKRQVSKVQTVQILAKYKTDHRCKNVIIFLFLYSCDQCFTSLKQTAEITCSNLTVLRQNDKILQ